VQSCSFRRWLCDPVMWWALCRARRCSEAQLRNACVVSVPLLPLLLLLLLLVLASPQEPL
jgi:hypothetical protein